MPSTLPRDQLRPLTAPADNSESPLSRRAPKPSRLRSASQASSSSPSRLALHPSSLPSPLHSKTRPSTGRRSKNPPPSFANFASPSARPTTAPGSSSSRASPLTRFGPRPNTALHPPPSYALPSPLHSAPYESSASVSRALPPESLPEPANFTFDEEASYVSVMSSLGVPSRRRQGGASSVSSHQPSTKYFHSSPTRLTTPLALAGLTDPSDVVSFFDGSIAEGDGEDPSFDDAMPFNPAYVSHPPPRLVRGPSAPLLNTASSAYPYNSYADDSEKTLATWMASTSTESQSFQSFAVRAESVWMEACSAADFEDEALPHMPGANRRKTAAAVEILLNVQSIFGRFKSFLEPVTAEIMLAVYDNANKIMSQSPPSREDLGSGVMFFDLVKQQDLILRAAQEELQLQKSGVQMSDVLKKRNGLVKQVMMRSKVVMRDMIFYAWSHSVRTRKSQLKMFLHRKKGRWFDKWRFNAKHLKDTMDNPAYQFKKRWQHSEREKNWLTEERDGLLEEMELLLMQKGEQTAETTALYRMLENRVDDHHNTFHSNRNLLGEVEEAEENENFDSYGIEGESFGSVGKGAGGLLANGIGGSPSKWKKAKAKIQMAGALGNLKTVVAGKIGEMKRDGLMSDIEETIKKEREAIMKRRRAVSDDFRGGGTALATTTTSPSPAPASETPLSPESEKRRAASENITESSAGISPGLTAANKRIEELEGLVTHNIDLLEGTQAEIKRLQSTIKDQSATIAKMAEGTLEERKQRHTAAAPKRRTMRQSFKVELMEQAKRSINEKECQTPEEWLWDHKMSKTEKLEKEAKERKEREMLEHSIKSVDTAKEMDSKQRTSVAHRRSQFGKSDSGIFEENASNDESRRNRAISVSNMRNNHEVAHPLKTTRMNAKTKGLLQILKNASVPDTAPPPIPLKLAEELCTLVWKEKWELDAAAYAREVKFPPLPEVMLDAFIQSQVHSHGIRSLAIKYFKSFTWACNHYKDKSPRLKAMYKLLNLSGTDAHGNVKNKSSAAENMSPKSSSRNAAKVYEEKKRRAMLDPTFDPEEDIEVYDSAYVQFFMLWLKKVFLSPDHLEECLNDLKGDYAVLKKMVCNVFESLFPFLRSKNPEKFSALVGEVEKCKLIDNPIDKRPHVRFDDIVGLVAKYFPFERESSGTAGSALAQAKAKQTLGKMFKAAKGGMLSFKMKHIGRLQDAFEKYDKKNNLADHRGEFEYTSFKELVQQGLGFAEGRVDDLTAIQLFNEWQDAVEAETGWEEYLHDNSIEGGNHGKALEQFSALSKQVKEDASKVDTRDENAKRRSVLATGLAHSHFDEKKQNIMAWKKAASKMRSVFYSSAFTQVDQEMATKLEISRGLMAAKIGFAKVLYAKNFFVDDHVVGKKNRFLGESDDDFDF